MDVFSAIQVASYTSGIGIQGLVGIVAGCAVICVELPKRFDNAHEAAYTPRALAKGCAHVAVRCMPEVTGLMLITGTAFLFRMFGFSQFNSTPVEAEVWQGLVHEWPILHGSDTLLGFQAMLRLLVLFAVVFRMKGKGTTNGEEAPRAPLSGMAAIFALAGMIARVSLSLQTHGYWLDGPLGQGLEVMYETAMVPLLTVLAYGAAKKSPITATAAIGGAALWASRHYLNFAEHESLDRLFTLAHTLEVLSAFALLYSTIRTFWEPRSSRNFSAYAGFFYLIMPIQQCLAAYYFLNTMAPWGHQVVGSGHPVCLLMIGNLLAFGAYMCAAAMWLASYLVDREDEDGHNDNSSSGTPTAAPMLNGTSFTDFSASNQSDGKASDDTMPAEAIFV
jgi:hypothetical protein